MVEKKPYVSNKSRKQGEDHLSRIFFSA